MQEPSVRPENVFNMDEMGVMLSMLSSYQSMGNHSLVSHCPVHTPLLSIYLSSPDTANSVITANMLAKLAVPALIAGIAAAYYPALTGPEGNAINAPLNEVSFFGRFTARVRRDRELCADFPRSFPPASPSPSSGATPPPARSPFSS